MKKTISSPMNYDGYSYERMLKLLKIEQKCVKRASGLDATFDGICNRDCAQCDLVQEETELLQMYENVIKLVEQKILEINEPDYAH